MPEFVIRETNQWKCRLQNPTKKKTSENPRSTLPGRHGLKKIQECFHESVIGKNLEKHNHQKN
jgi:hypothetical protein